MRVRTLALIAASFFCNGILLSLLFPLGTAIGSSGQGHPWAEVSCDTTLCVQQNEVGLGTTNPSTLLTVQGNPTQAEILLTGGSQDKVPSIHFHGTAPGGTISDYYATLTQGGKLQFGESLSSARLSITTTGIEIGSAPISTAAGTNAPKKRAKRCPARRSR